MSLAQGQETIEEQIKKLEEKLKKKELLSLLQKWIEGNESPEFEKVKPEVVGWVKEFVLERILFLEGPGVVPQAPPSATPRPPFQTPAVAAPRPLSFHERYGHLRGNTVTLKPRGPGGENMDARVERFDPPDIIVTLSNGQKVRAKPEDILQPEKGTET